MCGGGKVRRYVKVRPEKVRQSGRQSRRRANSGSQVGRSVGRQAGEAGTHRRTLI